MVERTCYLGWIQVGENIVCISAFLHFCGWNQLKQWRIDIKELKMFSPILSPMIKCNVFVAVLPLQIFEDSHLRKEIVSVMVSNLAELRKKSIGLGRVRKSMKKRRWWCDSIGGGNRMGVFLFSTQKEMDLRTMRVWRCMARSRKMIEREKFLKEWKDFSKSAVE